MGVSAACRASTVCTEGPNMMISIESGEMFAGMSRLVRGILAHAWMGLQHDEA